MFAMVKDDLTEQSKMLLPRIFYANGLLNLDVLKGENLAVAPVIHNTEPGYLNTYDILTSAADFVDEAVELENESYRFENNRHKVLVLDKNIFIRKMADIFAGEYVFLGGAAKVIVNVRQMDVCVLIAPIEKFSLVYGVAVDDAIEQTREFIYEEMIHSFDVEMALALLHQAERLSLMEGVGETAR